jgi:hypothetical protein
VLNTGLSKTESREKSLDPGIRRVDFAYGFFPFHLQGVPNFLRLQPLELWKCTAVTYAFGREFAVFSLYVGSSPEVEAL